MENNSENPLLFWNDDYFSNFAPYSIEYKGIHWMTSEHAYQASKFEDEKIIEEIKNASSAMEAFSLGRKFMSDYRKDWYEIRVRVMEDIARTKLNQHIDIQERLIETGKREIIESSPEDAFWGWGPNKDGENQMGKIWMKLRSELQSSS